MKTYVYRHRFDGRRYWRHLYNETPEKRSMYRLKKQVMDTFVRKEFFPKLFVTLTFDKEHYPDSVEDGNNLVSLFVKRMKDWYRLKGIKVKYVWKGEFGKRGFRLHYHLFFDRSFIHSFMLYKWWGNGIIHFERITDPGKATKYITKYISKNTDCVKRYLDDTNEITMNRSPGVRRFGKSNGFKKDPSDWRLERLYFWKDSEDYRRLRKAINKTVCEYNSRLYQGKLKKYVPDNEIWKYQQGPPKELKEFLKEVKGQIEYGNVSQIDIISLRRLLK